MEAAEVLLPFCFYFVAVHEIFTRSQIKRNRRKINPRNKTVISTGCPVCLVLKQGAVNQLFFEVFLMFLDCLDHSRWAKFHLGILGPRE